MDEQRKLRVLIPHWIEHNDEHAQEFLRFVVNSGEAASDLEEAASRMAQVNQALAAALQKLGGPLEPGYETHHHHPHH